VIRSVWKLLQEEPSGLDCEVCFAAKVDDQSQPAVISALDKAFGLAGARIGYGIKNLA
jgi:hypothetical protein